MVQMLKAAVMFSGYLVHDYIPKSQPRGPIIPEANSFAPDKGEGESASSRAEFAGSPENMTDGLGPLGHCLRRPTTTRLRVGRPRYWKAMKGVE